MVASYYKDGTSYGANGCSDPILGCIKTSYKVMTELTRNLLTPEKSDYPNGIQVLVGSSAGVTARKQYIILPSTARCELTPYRHLALYIRMIDERNLNISQVS